MQAVKQWFLQLSERERVLVLAASGVSLIVLFYYLLWAPLNNALDTQHAGLEADRKLLVWVQEQSSRAKLLQSTGQVTRFSGSLTQLVNQTTRSANISVSRLQPQDDELQVWIDEVPFNALMQWLADLEQRGVVILQSDFSETNKDGLVQVRRLQLGKG
ncbi:type II secretion system protein GspM [Glaciecola siphonariae]|uniref:Type II secretion system protein M n=1 Tax=Glaciecola siphonariae TaxID=521012 RepID=A0ABV9LSM3_9ALTE